MPACSINIFLKIIFKCNSLPSNFLFWKFSNKNAERPAQEQLYIISYMQQLLRIHHIWFICIFNFSEAYKVRRHSILKSFSMHVLRIRIYKTTILLSHLENLFLILSNILSIFKLSQFSPNCLFFSCFSKLI